MSTVDQSLGTDEPLDPAALAELVSSVDEASLRELLEPPEVRAFLVDEIVARFAQFVDIERSRGVRYAVAFVIAPDDRLVVRVEDGVCVTVRDDSSEVQATLTADAADLVRLLTANADPSLLVLEGRLRVEGDGRAALGLAACFRMPGIEPGGGAGRIDPLGVDAGAIARVVRDTSDSELRERLRGDVRDVMLSEAFNRFADHARPERLKGVDAVVNFRITGREDGELDRWSLRLRDGACEAERDAPDKARVTIRLDEVEFLKVVTGNANAVVDFVRGRIKLKGDVGFAAKLFSYFDVPTATP